MRPSTSSLDYLINRPVNIYCRVSQDVTFYKCSIKLMYVSKIHKLNLFGILTRIVLYNVGLLPQPSFLQCSSFMLNPGSMISQHHSSGLQSVDLVRTSGLYVRWMHGPSLLYAKSKSLRQTSEQYSLDCAIVFSTIDESGS